VAGAVLPQSTPVLTVSATSKSEKHGNIRKCPACGAEVPAMVAVCSECGHEFSNVQVSSTVQAFFEKLDAIDQAAYEKESAREAKGPLGGAWGAMFGLDAMVKTFSGMSSDAKRKIAMIEGYPIPNSKEDITEFVLLASTRYKHAKKPLIPTAIGAQQKMEEFQIDNAWRVKCEQAYSKAKFSFGSDRVAITEIERLLKEKKVIK
jgi:hypothetical protein